jgi:hypothetical protein
MSGFDIAIAPRGERERLRGKRRGRLGIRHETPEKPEDRLRYGGTMPTPVRPHKRGKEYLF